MIENAIITGTSLGIEDHGIFTCNLQLSGDGWGCGFGGYALDQWDSAAGRRIGTAYGIEFLLGIMKTLEVETWEQLKGRHVRAETDSMKVLKIGHFIKNQWFDPKSLNGSK